MRVLLIDDDHTPREILKSIVLSKYPDAIFTECVNGQEGIDTYDSDDGFDIIFIDYVMPEKDGSEVVEHIRKEKGDKATPLIMCTSKNDRKTVLKLIEAGVSDYLAKPFDTDRALAKIERALKRKKARETKESPAPTATEESPAPEGAKESPAPTATEESPAPEGAKETSSSLKHASVGDDIIDDSETQVIDLDESDDDGEEAMELSDDAFN